MNCDSVVVLSGGQDSTTCLAWRLQQGGTVHAVSFDYGQRHRVELKQAVKIAALAGVQHEVLDLRTLGQAAPSALTRSDIEVSTTGGMGGLPSTFTPGRNLVFLTLAASYALARGAKEIVTGVCQTDYSGYPDCRQDTIITLRNAIRLGTDVPDFEIKTPLMHLTKAQSVELAAEIGALDLLAESHTCYEGHRPACGKCPACVIRLRGFEQAGIRDPLQYAV